jgi:hypothetical protein
MGDKGFNEKNFKLMKDTMEAEKARKDAEEQEAAVAAADGEEEPPGGRKDRKKGGECQRDVRALCRCLCSELLLSGIQQCCAGTSSHTQNSKLDV